MPDSQTWDVIVVGTGMGGATLGHALAAAGWRVLFCEQGRDTLDADQALAGAYPEMAFRGPKVAREGERDLLARAGRAWRPLDDRSSDRAAAFVPYLGAGVGGSSALYGMALERFFPSDFAPAAKHPGAIGHTLPARWPIDYETLAPYYAKAEALYGVRGEADPLRVEDSGGSLPPAPDLTPANLELKRHFEARGLHPYRLPSACAFLEECSGCQGFLCPRPCKSDSARTCLAPALDRHGARLLSDCRVTRLTTQDRRVAAVQAWWNGQEITLTGRMVVLAAGALNTPEVLLRSACEAWPDGLANRSGQVGRNLMRHLVDLYAITPKARLDQTENPKELALNDFYLPEGGGYGTVQSFGRLPPVDMVVDSLADDLRRGPGPLAAAAFSLAKPLARRVLGGKLGRSLILASLLEDLPYHDNRVRLAGDGLALEYRLQPYELGRVQAFRAVLLTLLKPFGPTLLKQAENNQRIAHICGTCRFGDDPKTSVLDRTNRAHGLDNLYVVDSSFFASSGGTNPSLTIAANALRVADHLLGKTSEQARSTLAEAF